MYVCVCVYIYIHIYVCVCVCVYVSFNPSRVDVACVVACVCGV